MAHYYGGGRGGRDAGRDDGRKHYEGSQERLDSYTATEATEDSYTHSFYGSQETLEDDRSHASSNKPPAQPRRFRPQQPSQAPQGGQYPRRDNPPNYDQYVSRPQQPAQARGYNDQARSPSPSQYSESQYSQSQYSESQYSQSQYSQSQYSEKPPVRGRYTAQQPGPRQAQARGYPRQPPVEEAPQGQYERKDSHPGAYEREEEYRGAAAPAKGYPAPSVSSRDPGESTGSRPHYATKAAKYSQRPYYQQKSGKPRTKPIVKEPGYYNMVTDTILHTKKSRRGVVLSVAKPYAKNYFQGARDFLPVAVVSLIFNPLVGWVPLAFALMARKANTTREPEKAAYFGRVALVTAIAAIIITFIFFIAMLSVTQSASALPPRLH